MHHCSLVCSSIGDIGIVRVQGAVDADSHPELEKNLREMLAEKKNIVVTLKDATLVCSAAWGSFVITIKKLRQKGGEVVLASMSPGIRSVYAMLGMKSLMKEFPSEADALLFLA